MQLRTIGLLMGSPDQIGMVRNCLSKLPLRVVMEAREIVSAAAQLRQACPNVLLLEVPVSEVLVSELLGVVAGLPVPPVIVAVGPEPTPEVLLEIMQLGIRGYLSAPYDAAKAWQILERLAFDNQTPAERHTGKTLGFLSAASGAGATTLACHIAAGLHSATGGNTVLADFDTAAGMVGFWMNIESPHSALDAVNNAECLDLNLWKGIVAKVKNGLDVLPAPPEPPVAELPAEPCLNVLRFARAYYDWMVLDLGRGRNNLVASLSGATDNLFLVTTAEIASLFQARRLLRWFENREEGRVRLKVIVNRLRKDQQYFRRQDVEKMLGAPVAAVLPDEVNEVHDAHTERRLVPPNAKLGKAVSALVGSIVATPQQDQPRPRLQLFR